MTTGKASETRVFDHKKYHLWNTSFNRGALEREAKGIRDRGLPARVATYPNKFAPRDVGYALYVHGSAHNLAKAAVRAGSKK